MLIWAHYYSTGVLIVKQWNPHRQQLQYTESHPSIFFYFCFTIQLTPSPLTFKHFVRMAILPGPWWVSGSTEVPQFQVANGQSYDGRLVQLACDGRRQRQHFGQFIELVVFLASPRPRRIPWLLLAQLQDAVIRDGGHVALLIKSGDD